ncbi:hypothetical protein CCR75_006327 [Bremia lactucae]|uniref:poly(ADP-ribose) glycohydrolase n=1 Tax=Bremia lactucae TaxID=4779 RepID=A0A976IG58_BRELC|nr:hypothetical protein CCR75_006327 [Bremia lactucae]
MVRQDFAEMKRKIHRNNSVAKSLMSRQFSFNGAVFAFHCLPQSECCNLKNLLQHNHGVIYDATKKETLKVVFVITSYRVDCEPPASLTQAPYQLVTCFWIKEILRLGRWLKLDSHLFFTPPPRPRTLWLQYPPHYQEVAHEQNVELYQNYHLENPYATALKRHKMRLPCAPSYLYRNQVPLWPYIAALLARPIQNVHDLTTRIQSLSLSSLRRPLNCLNYAVTELLTQNEQKALFTWGLPQMVQLILTMPQLFKTPPPLLTPPEISTTLQDHATNTCAGTNKTRIVTQTHQFTKLEVLTLLCGCFFGIVPDQDIVQNTSLKKTFQTFKNHYPNETNLNFPTFSAIPLFSASKKRKQLIELKGQKIRCLLQYFLQVLPRDKIILSNEVIDFTRISVQLPRAFKTLDATLSPHELIQMLQTTAINSDNTSDVKPIQKVQLSWLRSARYVSNTTIETLEKHVQIIFANEFAGGGVFNAGCVQEEIRFLVSPELLVACLVVAKLEPQEAFGIYGTEKFCTYHGYGNSFAYRKSLDDRSTLQTLSNGKKRRECIIVGIDATNYCNLCKEHQYSRKYIFRDFMKAFAGFAYPDIHNKNCSWPVATGNWGCGVFQGDREVKFLI